MWGHYEDLKVDINQLLPNKLGTLTAPGTEIERREDIKEYLSRFGVKNYAQAKRYLLKYFRLRKMKDVKAKLRRLRVLRQIYGT